MSESTRWYLIHNQCGLIMVAHGQDIKVMTGDKHCRLVILWMPLVQTIVLMLLVQHIVRLLFGIFIQKIMKKWLENVWFILLDREKPGVPMMRYWILIRIEL